MVLGWLSPDGEMIEAGYLEHIIVADKICEKYYNTYIDSVPDDFLLEKGWVHITMTMWIDHAYWVMWAYSSHHLTQAQKDYLRPVVINNWNWISKSCQRDLKEELELDLEIEESYEEMSI